MILKNNHKNIQGHKFPSIYSKHICFIIPEYVNKKIVEKGTKKQKEQAWKNLVLTEQLRGRRSVTGLMSSMFSVSNRLDLGNLLETGKHRRILLLQLLLEQHALQSLLLLLGHI